MPDKPPAEVLISPELIRGLLASQAADTVPDAVTLPLRKVADGWDNELWRLGPELAVRLPRRALAAPLVLHEQQALPRISAVLEPLGIRVPAPVVSGRPGDGFPWPWSVVPWFGGDGGLDIPRAARAAWAEPLAAALGALHTAAPEGFPVNPVRGVPLATRGRAVAERMALLHEASDVPRGWLDTAESAWRSGLVAAEWSGPPVWIHGDLHPGNLVAQDGSLTAIIDFGDVTAGDPAYDLAVAWLAFDAYGREVFVAATGARYDPATWTRARAWAAAFAVLLLSHSDDDPDYARLGLEALEEL
ncbi:aminoglycoside phosphotransferase family protein [Microbacterium sp. NPDC019599]|uniref:aminoglycoside phosphotransferase family protein n=1 Tax=Microbacterium sp. NPDC019599 TaxID=3154690 RepID=UPI0033DAC894